jgi:hypothetical protein
VGGGKMRFGKGAVIFVFVQVTLFTAVVCFFAWRNHEQVPDALIGSFFAWFAIEGGALALLKIDDRKKKNDSAALKKEKTTLEKENAALKKQLEKVQKAAGIPRADLWRRGACQAHPREERRGCCFAGSH